MVVVVVVVVRVCVWGGVVRVCAFFVVHTQTQNSEHVCAHTWQLSTSAQLRTTYISIEYKEKKDECNAITVEPSSNHVIVH